eukprot:SAG31_NODE_4995_length_2814_cov_1.128545_3_plen_283_part_00
MCLLASNGGHSFSSCVVSLYLLYDSCGQSELYRNVAPSWAFVLQLEKTPRILTISTMQRRCVDRTTSSSPCVWRSQHREDTCAVRCNIRPQHRHINDFDHLLFLVCTVLGHKLGGMVPTRIVGLEAKHEMDGIVVGAPQHKGAYGHSKEWSVQEHSLFLHPAQSIALFALHFPAMATNDDDSVMQNGASAMTVWTETDGVLDLPPKQFGIKPELVEFRVPELQSLSGGENCGIPRCHRRCNTKARCSCATLRGRYKITGIAGAYGASCARTACNGCGWRITF